MRLARSWVNLCLLALAVPAAWSAELTAPTLAASAGSTVAAPFVFTIDPGQVPAAVQFELVFNEDQLRLTALQVSPPVAEAGKTVSSNRLAPGRYRIIVAGLNQNPIPPGVLLEGTLEVPAAAFTGFADLDIEALVVSNPSGRPIPSTSVSGGVAIEGREPPDCGCHGGAGVSAGAWSDTLCVILVLAALLRSHRRLRRAGAFVPPSTPE